MLEDEFYKMMKNEFGVGEKILELSQKSCEKLSFVSTTNNRI